MSILKNFQLSNLKQMNIQEQYALAEEIRSLIIDVVSQKGGHLSANLGVVELTIAMHKVFDSPHDLFFFDVSHQTYTHKILTGRSKEFVNLRQLNGISGFSKRSESVHDIYEMGHSSTSISAALGYLEAKKTNPNLFGDAICVIGDASIVNGLALEALNYLGAHKDEKMIIIINDNDMSISKNVGALARSFNKVRIRRDYEKLHKLAPRFIKRAIQSIVYPPSLFNCFGLKYFEGIDGHDLKQLEKYLTYAKNLKQSVVLHVITHKGKGYEFAENDQTGRWHHTPPFDITTGKLKDENNYIQSLYGEKIVEYLVKKPDIDKIRIITPGMGLGCGISKYLPIHPRLFIDVGIAEENAVVIAAGIAQTGLIPIIFSYSTFFERSFGEILHDVARTNQHVIFCIDRSGIVGGDGDTHQGIFDLAYLRLMPNIRILAPISTKMAIQMLDYAIINEGPFAIRYPKLTSEKLSFTDIFKDLKWSIIKKGLNNNKIIITYGPIIHEVYNALESIPEVGLINAVTLAPIDEAMIDYLSNNYKKIIIFEEVNCQGSLYEAIASYIIKKNHQILVDSITLNNTYLETGNVDDLREKYHVSIKDLLIHIKEK